MTPLQAQFQLAISRVKKPRSMRRIQPPTRQAERFTRDLQRYTAEMFAISADLFRQHAKPAIAGAITHDADPIGYARDIAEQKLNAKWSRSRLSKIVQISARDVQRFHAGQFRKQMEAIVSVDVIGSEPWLEPVIEQFTNENVALIKSISSRYFTEIEREIKEEIATGARWEEMADTLRDRYGVSRSRAELIARDQTGKFYGALNERRQTALGIDSFVWRTVKDNRVREEHEDLDGEVFKWSSPPSEGIPGEPVQCRCYADPVIEGFASE